MADRVERNDIRQLTERVQGPSVSIFMPTHRAGPQVEQDPIRLKNLLGRAEQGLVDTGLRSPDARAILDPARELLEDRDFWQRQSDGLALYPSRDGLRTFRVPLDLEELVVVANRFHVKPLLPLFTVDGRFFVLALSQGEVRLLQGSRFHVEEVELRRIPEDLRDAMRYEDLEKERQLHVATRGGVGATAVFHAHGVGGEIEKALIARFFRQVDTGLWNEVLHDEDAFLVLAGVDFLLPIYRDVTRYPHVLEEGVVGNPDELRPEELHARAWGLLEPVFEKAVQADRDRYGELEGTGRTATQLPEVLTASERGRVDVLFTGIGEHRWGRAEGDLQLHDEPEPGDEDLLDLAAVRTLLSSGAIHAVDRDSVPGGGPVAAILRY